MFREVFKRKMSGRECVCSKKCPIGEVYGRRSVQLMEYPVGEMSDQGSVQLREMFGPGSADPGISKEIRTCPGKIGAIHICLPSCVSLIPSTSLSGVRTSSSTLSKIFTLCGNAVMSTCHRLRLKYFKLTDFYKTLAVSLP